MMWYTAADGREFNLTLRLLGPNDFATLFRLWEDPDTGRLSVHMFTMPFDLFARGVTFIEDEPDIHDYIVYQIDTKNMWRYRTARCHANLLNDFFGSTIQKVVQNDFTKQYLLPEYDQISPMEVLVKALLLDQADKIFPKLSDKMERIDSF
jgi:hypothetical protein